MSTISFRLDARSFLRPLILGLIVGIILAVLEILAPESIPDVLLVLAYAAILILISAPFLHSTPSGLMCGIITLITQVGVQFAYYGWIFGVGLAAAALTYSALFIYKVFALPAAGALAGYLSKKL